MKPRIILESRVPSIGKVLGLNPVAITLGCWIFVAGKTATPTLIQHETIHVKQWNEMLWVGFMLFYGWDYLKGIILYRSSWKAYRSSRFEQEAREGQSSEGYVECRRRFAWWHYKVRSPV